MILRFLTITGLALALSAVPASAALVRDTPIYIQSFTDPGAVTVENPSSLPYNFAWFADKPGSGSSNIYGYFPSHSDEYVQTTISRSYSDPEGDIGRVSGLAFDQVHHMLYVADTEKNRILWYPRINATLPADQVDYGNVGQQPGPVSDSGAAAGSAVGSFDGLNGITAWVDGFNNVKLIAADENNARIQIFDAGAGGLSDPPVSIDMPGGAEPRDVAVDPETGKIYVSMTDGGPEIIQVFSSAGADLGQFGDATVDGTYDELEFDPDKRVLYASKQARVDVINPASENILGSYMYSAFSELGPSGDRMVKKMSVLGGTGQIFVARFDPAGVLNGGSGPEDPAPAQSYLTPNPASCTAGAPASVEVGDNTINIIPDCTDEDGSTIQDFTVLGASRGSATHSADFHSIDYTAPASGGGYVTIPYRVTTIDGISAVYYENVIVTDSSRSIAQELFPGRPLMSSNLPGIVYNEGVGGIAEYLWHADSDGNQTILRGYDQVDAGGPPQTSINCGPSTAAGEFGGNVSGIAYLPNQNLLLVADYDNSRIVAFERFDNNAAPVDCDTAVTISSVGGQQLLDPRGLAVDRETGTAYVTIRTFSNPDGGVVSFNPVTLTLGAYREYSGPDIQLGPLSFANGKLFAGVNGTGTVHVFNSDLSDAAGYPELDGGTPEDDYLSIAAEPNTNRLWAIKSDALDVFSLTTGTHLGRVEGIYWGSSNLSVSPIENYQQFAVSNSEDPHLRDFWANPNPICTPGAPLNVQAGQNVTFTPSCTDNDNSAVREFSVVNSQALGSAAPTPDRAAVKYSAGSAAGQDAVAYSVNTQDGLSVSKTQMINVTAAPAPPAEEKPVVRVSTNLQLDSGDVYIKIPGSDEFVKLTKDTLIPIGTVIDAREGKAHITLANADGTTYDGIFWDGVFQVTQGSGSNPIATMKLRDDLVAKASGFATSSTTAELERSFFAYTAKKRGKKKNGLWGDAKGRYRTTGKGGSATVRGTRWYVANYTHGSLFKVQRGVVTIDPIRGKNFNLKAGKQFFIFYKR